MIDEQADYFDNLLKTFGVEVFAKHVPLEGPLTSDTRIDWRITIHHQGRKPLVTDYHQGLGHLPKHPDLAVRWGSSGKLKLSIHTHGLITSLLRKGSVNLPGAVVRLTPPRAIDVLYCLLIDYEVFNYASFEDYASDQGLDPDSRRAESIYKACLRDALHLRALLGDELIATLNHACADR